jgi:hypothetical protein
MGSFKYISILRAITRLGKGSTRRSDYYPKLQEMKKTTALLAGFLLFTIVLHAQKKQPKYLAELNWDGYYQNQNGTWTAGGGNDKTPLPWSFCYQVSLALEYKLSRNLNILLDINSFNTTAKKEFTYTIYPSPGSTAGQVVTVNNKYKQATVNVLAGIGFRFLTTIYHCNNRSRCYYTAHQ